MEEFLGSLSYAKLSCLRLDSIRSVEEVCVRNSFHAHCLARRREEVLEDHMNDNVLDVFREEFVL